MPADYKLYTIESTMLPPIHGLKVVAASADHARKKAVKQKRCEINILIAQDILKCDFGNIAESAAKKINRKALSVIRSGGRNHFSMVEAWSIAMPDKKAALERRKIRHAIKRAMIAFLRRNTEPSFHDGKSTVEHGNDYYSRHPEMMLKQEFRKS